MSNTVQQLALRAYSERMHAAFRNILDIELDKLSAGVSRAEVDGLLFEFVPLLGGDDHLRLIERCENCGKEMGGGVPIFTLIDLAEWLMQPRTSEFCSECRGGADEIPF